ncbi:MAG: OadG family protein [Prolixibacteraceae bacterium]|jgi:Na+-transporting methylmalonyl-CoA/oxaloacetate decarboxylase gamma subunit|nr:OadG family protein [Prolixibacteraceae bacterium]
MTLLEVTSQTWTITLIGWSIVFTALVLLIFVFTNVPRFLKIKFTGNRKKTGKAASVTKSEASGSEYISGGDTAAIAMAIHLFFEEQHDEESNVITIKRIQRRYSPWSSKIYGMRNFPN